METLIADYLSKLEFGELQSFKNMGVIPLLTSINGSPKYLTLKEALEKKLLNHRSNEACLRYLLRTKPRPS